MQNSGKSIKVGIRIWVNTDKLVQTFKTLLNFPKLKTNDFYANWLQWINYGIKYHIYPWFTVWKDLAYVPNIRMISFYQFTWTDKTKPSDSCTLGQFFNLFGELILTECMMEHFANFSGKLSCNDVKLWRMVESGRLDGNFC